MRWCHCVQFNCKGGCEIIKKARYCLPSQTLLRRALVQELQATPTFSAFWQQMLQRVCTLKLNLHVFQGAKAPKTLHDISWNMCNFIMSCPLRGRVNRAATQVSRRPYRRYFEVETEHLQYKNVSIDIRCFITLHGFSLGDCGNCVPIQKKRSDLADTKNFDHGHWRCASIFPALGR